VYWNFLTGLLTLRQKRNSCLLILKSLIASYAILFHQKCKWKSEDIHFIFRDYNISSFSFILLRFSLFMISKMRYRHVRRWGIREQDTQVIRNKRPEGTWWWLFISSVTIRWFHKMFFFSSLPAAIVVVDASWRRLCKVKAEEN